MRVLIVIVLVLFLASLWDIKKGKIPNFLILVGAAYGLLRVLYYQNFLSHIPGIIAPIIILYPLYKIGTLGAGDLKLLSILGFYFPFMETAYCTFLAFALGALYALFILVKDGDYQERFVYFMSYIKDVISTGRIRYYYEISIGQPEKKTKLGRKVHMAIPIFLSVFVHLGGSLL